MRILPVVLLAFVGACAPALQSIVPTPKVLTDYNLGEVQTAGIGEAIFDVQTARVVPAFQAVRAYSPGRIGLFIEAPKLEPGQQFHAAGLLPNGSYVVSSPSYSDVYSLVVTPEGRVESFYDPHRRIAGGSWPDDVLLQPVQGLQDQQDAFRAQMIYSGMDGTTIRTSYREFSGDFIRPAFSQELQYDLSQDSVIAYKTIKIRVLEATNSKLVFRVLEDGQLPWLPMR